MTKTLLVLIFVLIFTSMVDAKCMKCSIDAMVCDGDTKFDAITKCGNPDYSEETGTVKEGSVRRGNVGISEQKIEKLFYNCGEKQFSKILTIKGGKIISIKDGDWGSGPVRCQ